MVNVKYKYSVGDKVVTPNGSGKIMMLGFTPEAGPQYLIRANTNSWYSEDDLIIQTDTVERYCKDKAAAVI